MAGLYITGQQLHKRETGIGLSGIFFCALFTAGASRTLLSGFEKQIKVWLLCAAICLITICLVGLLMNSRWKGWTFPVVTFVFLLIIIIRFSDVKNGICIQTNRWLHFLTGKTGRIYLDYAVHGQAGRYLVLFLILAYISALLVMSTAHQWIIPGMGILVIAVMGCMVGFFRPDAGIVAMIAGYTGFMLNRTTVHNSWKSQLLMLPGYIAVILVAFVVSVGAGYLAGQRLPSDQVKQSVETAIHEKRYDHGSSVLSDGNLVNLGSFKKSKKTALKITMEEPQKLYLRGMTADTYTGSSWETLDAKAYQKGENLFYWLHQSDFYGQNTIGNALKLADSDQKSASLKITNVSACSKYQYLPYAMKGTTGLAADQIGDDRNLADTSEQKLTYYTGSVPQWYQTAVWLAAHQKEQEVSDYLALEESYRKYVYTYDLQITNTAVGVCEQLLGEEKDQEERSLSEILQLVRNTLDDKLEYRTDTVTYNGNNDFFKYTMEQSKGGYSVQYATAATLMLRYLGVPARYVEGYYLSPQEAEKYQSGDEIKITKAQAHAWAEYYLDGVGWIPFEVTPGYIDEEEDQELTKILADGQGEGEGQTFQKSPLTYTPPAYQQESETMPDQTPHFRFRTRYVLSGILLAVIVLILAGLLWILYRRRKLVRFLKEMDESDRRTAIIGLYGYSQMLLGRYGSEIMADHTTENAEAEHINAEARFSRHEMEEDKLLKIQQYTDKVIQNVKVKKGFWKKFRDHYLLWLYR